MSVALGVGELRFQLLELGADRADLRDQPLLLVAVGLADRLGGLVLRRAELLHADGELPAGRVGGEQLVDRLPHAAARQRNAEGLRVFPESFDIEHLPHTFT